MQEKAAQVRQQRSSYSSSEGENAESEIPDDLEEDEEPSTLKAIVRSEKMRLSEESIRYGETLAKEQKRWKESSKDV